MAITEARFEDVVTNAWSVLLLRGLAGILFGLLVMIMPGITLLALVYLFGTYAFIDGVLNLVTAFRTRNREEPWWALALSGIAGVAAGVLTFLFPLMTALALLYLIAAWAIITGALEIAAAIRLRKVITGEWRLVLAGMLSIGLGVLIAPSRGAGALGLVLYIGAMSVAFGIVVTTLAFRLRAMHEQLHGDHARRAPASAATR